MRVPKLLILLIVLSIANAICALAETVTKQGASRDVGRLISIDDGDIVVTRFSGSKTVKAPDGSSKQILDPDQPVLNVVDLGSPNAPPLGSRLKPTARRLDITAGQIGQVFGIALDDEQPPNIYVAATSAFGLHRGENGWAQGMWGKSGGPGTVYKLNASKGYKVEVFAQIKLDGRENTGPALGNLAYDAKNKQLFVSDLETGMVHRIRADDGKDLGHYDHGTHGRSKFLNVAEGKIQSLPQVAFVPQTTAQIEGCAGESYSTVVSCWNIANFRRRVWGVAVSNTKKDGYRLYYSVWSSSALRDPTWNTSALEERRNSIWSVRLREDGSFDTNDIRREFALPTFHVDAEDLARFGESSPASDIAFPRCTDTGQMLVAERGGIRNLGLGQPAPFARPHESRVLLYGQKSDARWSVKGRYEVGYYDRKRDKPPYIRANSSGGADFARGYAEQQQEWRLNKKRTDTYVWKSGDALCSRYGPCWFPETHAFEDRNDAFGLHGGDKNTLVELLPEGLTGEYPEPGPAFGTSALEETYIVDLSSVLNPASGDKNRAGRFDGSTLIGDIAVHQNCPKPPSPAEDGPATAGGQIPIEGEAPPTSGPTSKPGQSEPEIAGPTPGTPEPPPAPPAPPDPGPGPLDLALSQSVGVACQANVDCRRTITITNTGLDAFRGRLAFTTSVGDAAGAMQTVQFVGMSDPEWLCRDGGPFVFCEAGDVHLAGGESRSVDLILRRRPVGNRSTTLLYCSAIDWFSVGRGFDNNPLNDGSCAAQFVTPEPIIVFPGNINLAGIAQIECDASLLCVIKLILSNAGGLPFNEPLSILFTLFNPPQVFHAKVNSVDPDTWACRKNSFGYACRAADLKLRPGATVQASFAIQLPKNKEHVRYCAQFNWLVGRFQNDRNRKDDRWCHTLIDKTKKKEGAYDLQVKRVQIEDCEPGKSCRFETELLNIGPDPLIGSINFQDYLTPKPKSRTTQRQIARSSWRCSTGSSLICSSAVTRIEPSFNSKIVTSLRFSQTAENVRSCIRLNTISRGAKETNIANNTSCVPVRFKQAAAPECVSGTLRETGTSPVRYSCECPRNATRTRLGPNRFRCDCRKGYEFEGGRCQRVTDPPPPSRSCGDVGKRGTWPNCYVRCRNGERKSDYSLCPPSNSCSDIGKLGTYPDCYVRCRSGRTASDYRHCRNVRCWNDRWVRDERQCPPKIDCRKFDKLGTWPKCYVRCKNGQTASDYKSCPNIRCSNGQWVHDKRQCPQRNSCRNIGKLGTWPKCYVRCKNGQTASDHKNCPNIRCSNGQWVRDKRQCPQRNSCRNIGKLGKWPKCFVRCKNGQAASDYKNCPNIRCWNGQWVRNKRQCPPKVAPPCGAACRCARAGRIWWKNRCWQKCTRPGQEFCINREG